MKGLKKYVQAAASEKTTRIITQGKNLAGKIPCSKKEICGIIPTGSSKLRLNQYSDVAWTLSDI